MDLQHFVEWPQRMSCAGSFLDATRKSRLDINRGIDALLHAYRVWLDDVESDVLPFLSVTLVSPAVKIGAVGFQKLRSS
jgi:hypothetical protein